MAQNQVFIKNLSKNKNIFFLNKTKIYLNKNCNILTKMAQGIVDSHKKSDSIAKTCHIELKSRFQQKI